ncbi:MAG: HD domain-containing phosphohydrolase [Opitutaceae bacterium]
MKPRILIVDDEPNVLAAYQRVLRHIYESVTATSAAEALHLLENDSAFAVIVSDMRMPGASGLSLLKQVQRTAPDIVRVMLTGADDQKTAMDAVNDGQVFRFLRKPCPGHVFFAVIQEAVEHHLVARKERDVLEKTLTGVVDTLTDMLSAADPHSSHHAQLLRDRALEVARTLGVQSTWEVESAALLLRIGVITLPSQILVKLNEGQPLTAPESSLFDRVPEIGAKLLENIPRLAPVASIIRNHRRGFDGSGSPVDGPSGINIPLGARILRPLADIQTAQARGMTFDDALESLRVHVPFYDPDVLQALEAVEGDLPDSAERGEYRMAFELRAGMRLASDALTQVGLPLVVSGSRLTGFLIARLHSFSELGLIREPLFVIPAVTPPAEPAESAEAAEPIEAPPSMEEVQSVE